ncbi:alpha/beta hydrolase [Jatrophihabitans fulvus]
MALRHDVTALLTRLSRPRYGREVLFEGADLPSPVRDSVRTRHGRVRCLRYPGSADGRYVHLHGGAFVMRYPQMDDFWARFVVATTGVEVVLPDYAVAPFARYPVAHDQMLDVAAHYARDRPLVVGGFSGGGNLAASVALRSREEGVPLRGQLLGVPSLDVAEEVGAKIATSPGGMIGPGVLTLAREAYFKDRSRRGEPTASPLLAPRVDGLPPALVVTAERDTLRREGDRYAARLRDAGVPTQHVVVPGVDHYFLHGAGETQARALMRRMADWIGSLTVRSR